MTTLLDRHPNASNRELAAMVGDGWAHSTIGRIRIELGHRRTPEEAAWILFISIAQQVRQLCIEEGHKLTDKQLAERIGIHFSTVRRWLRKLGIPNGRERRFHSDVEFFRKMWEDGWADAEVSRVMGCHHTRVQKWRVREGLVANMIHDNLRGDVDCKAHTPTTLLDMIGQPIGRKKLDTIWAFAALGSTEKWLKKRFPDVSKAEIARVVDHLLAWKVPKNLKRVIRRKQLIEGRKPATESVSV